MSEFSTRAATSGVILSDAESAVSCVLIELLDDERKVLVADCVFFLLFFVIEFDDAAACRTEYYHNIRFRCVVKTAYSAL